MESSDKGLYTSVTRHRRMLQSWSHVDRLASSGKILHRITDRNFKTIFSLQIENIKACLRRTDYKLQIMASLPPCTTQGVTCWTKRLAQISN